MTVRNGVIGLSAAVLAIGVVEIVLGHAVVWIVLVIYAGLVLLALLVERPRYHRSVDRSNGPWRFTGERFTDPASGELVEVFERPQTGERDYRRADVQRARARGTADADTLETAEWGERAVTLHDPFGTSLVFYEKTEPD